MLISLVLVCLISFGQDKGDKHEKMHTDRSVDRRAPAGEIEADGHRRAY